MNDLYKRDHLLSTALIGLTDQIIEALAAANAQGYEKTINVFEGILLSYALICSYGIKRTAMAALDVARDQG